MWRQTRFLHNIVEIEIRDGCSERFINLCRYNGIIMWEIREEQGTVHAKMSKKDFLRVRPYVRKAQVHVRVIKKKGLGFIAYHYRKHYSFLVGLTLSLVILKVMSLYIWNISFTGNTEYTNELLMQFLKSQYYEVGMKVHDIDCDDIERKIRSEYGNVTWVSAEIRGTRLVIHIKENDGFVRAMVNEQENQGSIYASCDGIVKAIVTRKGTPMVHVGDQVQAGDELVSGVIPIMNDEGEVVSEENVAADGEIVIKTEQNYSDSVTRIQDKKIYTGRVKKVNLYGVGADQVELQLNITRFKDADVVTEIKDFALVKDFYLPFWHGTRIYYEYEIKPEELSDEELENKLQQNLETYLHKLEQNNVQICANRVNINLDRNRGVCEGIIEADVTEGSNNRQ